MKRLSLLAGLVVVISSLMLCSSALAAPKVHPVCRGEKSCTTLYIEIFDIPSDSYPASICLAGTSDCATPTVSSWFVGYEATLHTHKKMKVGRTYTFKLRLRVKNKKWKNVYVRGRVSNYVA